MEGEIGKIIGGAVLIVIGWKVKKFIFPAAAIMIIIGIALIGWGVNNLSEVGGSVSIIAQTYMRLPGLWIKSKMNGFEDHSPPSGASLDVPEETKPIVHHTRLDEVGQYKHLLNANNFGMRTASKRGERSDGVSVPNKR